MDRYLRTHALFDPPTVAPLHPGKVNPCCGAERVRLRCNNRRFDHLGDNIWSVREDSALALGDVLKAYGEEAFARVLPELEAMLKMARDQPSDSVLYVSEARLIRRRVFLVVASFAPSLLSPQRALVQLWRLVERDVVWRCEEEAGQRRVHSHWAAGVLLRFPGAEAAKRRMHGLQSRPKEGAMGGH